MKHNIEFIYFDVGGVAVLDFSKTNKWNEMLDDLKLEDEIRTKFMEMFDEYEPELCTGLEVDDFAKEASSKLDIIFPENYSMLEDFVNRFDPNPELAKIIEELPKRYKKGLLTNMYPGMLNLIKEGGLLPNTNWNAIVNSAVVGFRKPQAEIFQIAEEMTETNLENILFVDNSQGHLDAAKEHGWQTLLYDPSEVEESNRKLLDLVT